MAKLVKLNREYWDRDGYGHWCPACGEGHEIWVGDKRPTWKFSGKTAAPTFEPSVKITWGDPDNPGKAIRVCHYFIRNGVIDYCSDCTHGMRGQKVPLPEIPDDKYISCERLA